MSSPRYVATSSSYEQLAPMTVAFDLDLGFTTVAGRSTLALRFYSWPFSIGHTFHLGSDDLPCTLILQTGSGGLIGGDVVRQRVSAHDGARAEVVGQGAMSVHGAHDDRAGVMEHVTLRVGVASLLHYRPEIRILFPRARLRQQTIAVVEPGGALVFSDALVLHPAVNETNFGDLISDVRVASALADGGSGSHLYACGPFLSEEIQGFHSVPPFVLIYRAFATVYLIAPHSSRFTVVALDAIATQVESIPGVYASVLVLPSEAGIAVRMAAEDGEKLRRGRTAAHDALINFAIDRVLSNIPDADPMTSTVRVRSLCSPPVADQPHLERTP
jgi:urease accessory protein UreH